MQQVEVSIENLRKGPIFQEAKCIKNSKAYKLCASENCSHPAVCCQDENCQCNLLHESCPQIRCKSLFSKINSKIIDCKSLSTKVTTLFQNLIDQISTILQDLQKIIKRYGLKKPEIEFLDYFQQSRAHNLKGYTVSTANKTANQVHFFDVDQVEKKIENFWNQIGQVVLAPLFSIKDIIQNQIELNNFDFEQQIKIITNATKKKLLNHSKSEVKSEVKLIKNAQNIFKTINSDQSKSIKNIPQLQQKEKVKGLIFQQNQQQPHQKKQRQNLESQKQQQKQQQNLHRQQSQLIQESLFGNSKNQHSLFQPFKREPLFGFLKEKPNIKQLEIKRKQSQENFFSALKKKQKIQNLFSPKKQAQIKPSHKDKQPIINFQEIMPKLSQKHDLNSANDSLEQKIQEIAEYMQEILGVNLIKSIKFVKEKGVKEGKVQDKQFILNLALEDPTYLQLS